MGTWDFLRDSSTVYILHDNSCLKIYKLFRQDSYLLLYKMRQIPGLVRDDVTVCQNSI